MYVSICVKLGTYINMYGCFVSGPSYGCKAPGPGFFLFFFCLFFLLINILLPFQSKKKKKVWLLNA